MIARVLPWNEWERLGNQELPHLFKLARPEDIDALVVEEGDKIAARVYATKFVHLEGFRVEPEHRNAGVVRSLARLMVGKMQSEHVRRVLAGAEDGDSQMLKFLARIGAERLPMQLFSLGIGG